MWERVRQTAVEELKLPRDVILGDVLVSFVGRCCVTIENYRGILIYDDSMVKLQAKHCKLEIRGKRLHIDYYDHDEMKITGQIQTLEFCD